MTTSGVQVAGPRSVKVASVGTRAGNRTAGGTSFSDMMSASASSKKVSSTAQTKVERAQESRAQTTNASSAKDVGSEREVAKAPEMTQETKENPQGVEGKVQQGEKPGDMPEGELPDEPVLSGDLVSSDSGENSVLDTSFVKSLKLFREASKILEMQKLGELKQAIMDSLQMDEEELEQLLEQMGTNMQGMLQPQLLQQLVVNAECGGDPMGLLTNESAMNTLKDLLAKAEDIQTDLSELSQTVEIPKLGEEDALLSQKAAGDAEESDFAQVLAKTANPDEKVVETKVENTGKQSEKELGDDMLKGEVQGQKETGFTFEAVRESGEAAKESLSDHTDSHGTRSDVKPGQATLGDQFLNFVADAAKTDEAEFAQLSKAEQVRAVADQILEKVRVVLSDKQTSMEISLTPESLGRVTLNLVSRHGALTAHFTAQNEVAKEAIQSQMVVLRENLESQGLKVEAIEVTVSNFDFTQNGGAAANNGGQENRQRGRRGLRFDESINDGGLPQGMSEAEQIAADLMERSGNQVDYTA